MPDGDVVRYMIKKMDDKGQMYVYEAIAVVIMIIAAVVFFINLTSTPTISRSDPLHQLRTYGDDALRSYDYKGLDLKIDPMIGQLISILPSDVSFYLIMNYGISEYICKVVGNEVEKGVDWNDVVFDAETVTSHIIMIDQDADIVDIQLILWYENI